MPGWDGSGNVTVTYDFTDDQSNSIDPDPARFDQNNADLTGAIENALAKDGQNAATADLDLGTSYHLINVADGADLTDSINFKQMQNSAGQYAVAGGSSNAYTLILSPAVTAYAAGQTFKFKANHTNTGSATLDVNGLGAKTIHTKTGGTIGANYIQNGVVYNVVYEGTVFRMVDDVPWGKQTISVPASAMIAALTNGPSIAQLESSSNAINYTVLDFDDGTDEYAHFSVPMPESWDGGTITFKVFWSTTATDNDGVAWALQGVCLGNSDVIDSAYGTAVVVTDDATNAAADMLITSESAAVTIGGSPTGGDIVFFRIFRDVSDANDDMTEDARLIAVQIFYTINDSSD